MQLRNWSLWDEIGYRLVLRYRYRTNDRHLISSICFHENSSGDGFRLDFGVQGLARVRGWFGSGLGMF